MATECKLKDQILGLIKEFEESKEKAATIQKIDYDEKRIQYYAGVESAATNHIKALRELL